VHGFGRARARREGENKNDDDDNDDVFGGTRRAAAAAHGGRAEFYALAYVAADAVDGRFVYLYVYSLYISIYVRLHISIYVCVSINRETRGRVGHNGRCRRGWDILFNMT
jgi:hypothetical protein